MGTQLRRAANIRTTRQKEELPQPEIRFASDRDHKDRSNRGSLAALRDERSGLLHLPGSLIAYAA